MNYFNFEDSQINAVGYTPTYTPTEVKGIEAPVDYVDFTSEIEMPKESDFVMLDIPDQEDFEEPTDVSVTVAGDGGSEALPGSL